MREAMLRAEVGDDVYGDDPTVRLLEARVASITGKAAALFVPSGTMGNQIALLCQTDRGDEVVVGEGAHCAFYESGAAGAWAGVQLIVAGRGGLFTADEVAERIKPPEYYHPRTRLVSVENTHNRGGGRVFPHADVLAIAKVARAHGLALHLDGARIWNASAATGLSVSDLAEPFDTVSVCFSKGLGAPVGSALCGTSDTIMAARRFRKMLGGGMRQVGILAAAALYAIDHHRVRIEEDHAAARVIAAEVARVEGVRVWDVETNMVNVETPGVAVERVIAAARRRGVLVANFGPHRIRAVTHLDLAPGDVVPAAQALAGAVRAAIEGTE
jgi:threonine aldolase